MNKILQTLGLLITLLAAALLLFGITPLWAALTVVTPGIILIAVSMRGEQARPKSAPGAPVVQTIYSADGQQRAVIKPRPDGKYQVEIQRFVHEDSPEFGPNDHWERQSAPMTDTLSSAVDIAMSYVRQEEQTE